MGYLRINLQRITQGLNGKIIVKIALLCTITQHMWVAEEWQQTLFPDHSERGCFSDL